MQIMSLLSSILKSGALAAVPFTETRPAFTIFLTSERVPNLSNLFFLLYFASSKNLTRKFQYFSVDEILNLSFGV